ncbi:kinase [Micractinium conductrix]|uniref:Kinase n=1 Tax=Micractinium conductrix TaxID=554055 RepID=A0A2P6VEY8_9CHLO|nr:kinase [Micractinium conductrix]|eukprot:PSC72637.1 kinase [Micractinium conductrix]
MARLVALAAALLALSGVAQAGAPPPDPTGYWAPYAEGKAVVYTAKEMLAALNTSTGVIMLCADIFLKPEDYLPYIPINVSAPGRTVMLRGDNMRRKLDWGAAMGLIKVASNTTLALYKLEVDNNGNRTAGLDILPYEVKGSVQWPTISGLEGYRLAFNDSVVRFDTSRCTPEFTQKEVARIETNLAGAEGAEAAAGMVQYQGGTNVWYNNATQPAVLFNLTTKEQIGLAESSFYNTSTSCYDSSAPPPAHSSSSADTAVIVAATVGSVVGVALLAAAVFLLYRRKRRQQLRPRDLEQLSKQGSGEDLSSLPSGKLSSVGTLQGKPPMSGQASGELQSHLLRARFGPIDGVQLGELLGRGAFGRVYRGRWKGAIVAVKVIDHRVGPGKSHDLSREPLLSMSVSHPNVVITHKMCVVKVNPSAASGSDDGEAGAAGSSAGSRSITGGALHASGSSGQLVPNLDGSGLVEIVSPHDVLQPGMYETWLITELCDRGSLAELVHGGRMGGVDPAQQRDAWLLLCLLDIALGLDYLHSNTIIHGDLKPANVLLKAARNDRRGFVCKLGDFGLSRALGMEETHIETQSYGTACYAAPELLSEGKLTKAADVFSLGIIVWEMLTASELYPGLTAMQVIIQVSQHGSRPDIPADCPPALAALMQRCWEADPALRPTAAQVVEDVRQQLSALLAPQRPAATAAPGSG